MLAIEQLKEQKNSSLEVQLKHVWTKLAETEDPIYVEDPANPCGNDLSGLLKSVWPELSARASDALALLEQSGWQAVYGPLDDESNDQCKAKNLVRAAAAVSSPSKPWLG